MAWLQVGAPPELSLGRHLHPAPGAAASATDLFLLGASVVMAVLARHWLRRGAGVPLLLVLQLVACALSAVLFAAIVVHPESWYEPTALIAFAPALVSFLFNFLFSRFPH